MSAAANFENLLKPHRDKIPPITGKILPFTDFLLDTNEALFNLSPKEIP